MIGNLRLKLISIHYGGVSVGEDIALDITVLDNPTRIVQRIRPGSLVFVHKNIANISSTDSRIDVELKIKLQETDLVFSDTLESKKTITIEAANKDPQIFKLRLELSERKKIVSKKVAMFTLVFLAEKLGTGYKSKLKQYKDGPGGEKYNIYDKDIEEWVSYWNLIYSQHPNPPPAPLDPNLVKAMLYIESEIGYYRPTDRYSGYPDVMQVANPDDKAIHVLRNDGKEKPESEVVNGKTEKIEFKQANASTPAESIKWGVRWLYHKAQRNVNEGVAWHTEWNDWETAAFKYNGNGDPNYWKKLNALYRHGKGRRNYLLWGLILFFIYFGMIVGLSLNNKAVPVVLSETVGESDIDDYRPAGKASSILLNGYFKVPTNERRSERLIKLTGGHHSYLSELSIDQLNSHYDNLYDEYDGPYSVTLEQSIEADIDRNEINDAIVVLGMSFGGTGYWRRIAVMLGSVDGHYSQVKSFDLDDRDVIENLIIEDNQIITDITVHAINGGICCPETRERKIFDISGLIN